jgi:hypothetical protein
VFNFSPSALRRPFHWLLWLTLVCVAAARPATPPPDLLVEGDDTLQGVCPPGWESFAVARSTSLVDWDPRGPGLLVLTSFGACDQLARIEAPLSPPQPLTRLPEHVAQASVRPGEYPPGVLLKTDQVGAEQFQVAYLDLASGSVQRLSDGMSRCSGAQWSPSGRWIACASNARNGVDEDLVLLAPGEKPRRLALNTGFLWI